MRYKQLFPAAEITAFEPDRELCAVLRRNLARNRITGVQVVEAAVWIESGVMEFISEGTDSGHLALEHLGDSDISQIAAVNLVKTVRLSDYLVRPVDLLKVDIEGAELPVLQDSGEKLERVERIVVEVHHIVDTADILGSVLMLLHGLGFHVSVNCFQRIDLRGPFTRRPQYAFDQWPLVCAWRVPRASDGFSPDVQHPRSRVG